MWLEFQGNKTWVHILMALIDFFMFMDNKAKGSNRLSVPFLCLTSSIAAQHLHSICHFPQGVINSEAVNIRARKSTMLYWSNKVASVEVQNNVGKGGMLMYTFVHYLHHLKQQSPIWFWPECKRSVKMYKKMFIITAMDIFHVLVILPILYNSAWFPSSDFCHAPDLHYK